MCSPSIPDDSVVTLDKLTYAGNLANLTRHRGRSAPPLRARATSATPPSCATCRRGGRGRALRRRDPRGSLQRGRRRVPAHQRHRHLHPAGGGAGRGLGRFIAVGTDEVYGSVTRGASREIDPAQPLEPVLGLEGGGGPPRARVLDHAPPARHRHPKQQQLRAVPVPREDDPALRHQRPRGRRASAVRRRQERPRLALRPRQLRRDRRRAAEGQGRRDLQHRRGQRVENIVSRARSSASPASRRP